MVAQVQEYHDNVRTDVFHLLPAKLGRILDFGGGIGATSAALKAAGRADYVVVADQVDDTCDTIDRTFTGDLEQHDFVRDLIARSGPFDTILCLDILEHLRDPWTVVRTLAAGLVPGGILITSLPNVNYRGIVLPLLFKGSWELQDAGPLDRTHLRWFTKASAIDMLSQGGLKVEEVDSAVGKRYQPLDRLTFRVFNRFLAVQYFFLARRSPSTV